MKQLLLVAFFLIAISCANKQDNNGLLSASKMVTNPIEPNGKISGDTSLIPKIHFEEIEFDFGDKIMEGEIVQHSFKFKNYGKSPLIISKAETSCGCTVTEYSKEPIAPNEYGTIKVSYNSSGRPGSFQKTINVVSNTFPNESKLTIIGDVVPLK